jgi:AraC-like DNA-binding protein/ligand-binding sensor domain-containing protein
MKRTLALLLGYLLFIVPLRAQLFRHLSLRDGMVSRHVIAIDKDRTGYLWMLNHEGVDRFDGTRMVHYDLTADEGPISPTRGLASLASDSTGTLWVISHTGDIFCYDERRDTFSAALDFTLLKPQDGRGLPITASYMDVEAHAIWLCTHSGQYLFSLSDHHLYHPLTGVKGAVRALTSTADGEYFLATDEGITSFRLTERSEEATSPTRPRRHFEIHADGHPALSHLPHVRTLYFSKSRNTLVLATADRGIYLYDIGTRTMGRPLTELRDVEVSALTAVPGQEDELYVATQGAGLYRLNLSEETLSPFLQANPNTPHSLQSDILNDLFIDDAQRLWMATYPMGVSIYSEHYPAHEWICHSFDNANSLSSGQIHDIIEDRDGDLWFATNDGVSCHLAPGHATKGSQWRTLLTQALSTDGRRNYTFTALCDLGDGRILAGGYMSGLYLIHKSTMKVEALPVPDKYVRSILLTHDTKGQADGTVWIGGQDRLTGYDLATHRIFATLHPGFPIATLAEQDADHLWVGTLNGLYRLDKRTGRLTRFQPHTEMGRITSICPTAQGITYFTTLGDGLWAYDPGRERLLHYTARNSSLQTDDLFCILPARDGRLILSTEKGITTFNPSERKFYHWGHDQGLMFTSFNPGAGLHTRDGRFLFGSEEGALAFSDTVTLHRAFHSRLVTDGVSDSLTLRYDENTLQLEVSSLNFDNPSSILYTWRLEGANDDWSAPGRDRRIRYVNLSPGHYRLHIRSLLADDLSTVEERTIVLTVRPPWWLSWPALLVYALLALGGCIAACRLFWLRRVKRQARKHAVVTLLAAQEMMEPLEQIKEPLSRLQQDSSLSREGHEMVVEALRRTESLDDLFIRRVSEVVQNNLRGNGLNVDRLCNELGISRTTLYHRLKEITGEAPADYIRRLRLDESARLLLTREYTVAEVSDMMGFSDPKYFTEVFKRYFNATPTQYIKQRMQAKSGGAAE